MILILLACTTDVEPPPASEPAPPVAEVQPEAAEVDTSAFKTGAEALLVDIDTKTDEEILAAADALTQVGLDLLPALEAQHPECTPYFAAIAEVGLGLKDLSLEEIESGYHQDGKLPEMPGPECYHGKDLVVHPATVAAMAKVGITTDEDRQMAKAEIAEVLGHLAGVE